MAKVAYVFPGQGSQFVGMGRDLYENLGSVKAIFNQADEVLGFSLSRLCFEGPENELRQTINAQPALVTMSYACLQATLEIADSALPVPDFVGGHSLGEYTALAGAGILDFPTVLGLARERGRLMHEAAKAHPGCMAAIIGLDEPALTEACKESGTWIANINCPGQMVISGANGDIARTIELAKAKGAGRAIPLQVSGAFHTPLMESALDGMSRYLANLTFRSYLTPIIGNTTAKPLMSVEEVKAELLRQLCNCVQWQRSIEFMINDGVSTFIEVGPGKVLTGLIKRISKDAKTINLGDLQSIKSLVSQAS